MAQGITLRIKTGAKMDASFGRLGQSMRKLVRLSDLNQTMTGCDLRGEG